MVEKGLFPQEAVFKEEKKSSQKMVEKELIPRKAEFNEEKSS